MLGDESRVGSSGGTFPKASLGRKLGAEIVERVNTEGFFFFSPGCRQRAARRADKPVLLISFVFRACVLLVRVSAGNLMKQRIVEGIPQSSSSARGSELSCRSLWAPIEGCMGVDGGWMDRRISGREGTLARRCFIAFPCPERSCCLLSHQRKM